MSKKLLQGIAAGIFLSTTIFSYQFYFNNQSITQNSQFEHELTNYLEEHNLIALDKDEYEELLSDLEKNIQVSTTEDLIVEEDLAGEVTDEIKEIVFIIEIGMSTGEIGLMLEQEGLIKDRKHFEEFIIKNGLETKVKAGTYNLSTSMSLEQIVEELS